MARRFLPHAVLILAAAGACALAAGWPGELTSGTNGRYWVDAGTTNWTADQWAINTSNAVAERSIAIGDSAAWGDPITYYRYERVNLEEVKEWIRDECGSFVNPAHTNAAGNLTNIVFWTADDLEAAVGATNNYLTAASTVYRALADTNTATGWHHIDDILGLLIWTHGYVGTFVTVTSHTAYAVAEATWPAATNTIATIWPQYSSSISDRDYLISEYEGNTDYDADVLSYEGAAKASGIETNIQRDVDLYLRSRQLTYDEYAPQNFGLSTNPWTYIETSTSQSNVITFGLVGSTLPKVCSTPTGGTTNKGARIELSSPYYDGRIILRHDVSNGFDYVSP